MTGPSSGGGQPAGGEVSRMTDIRQVDTREAPRATRLYSQGTIVNGFIFVSGQLPIGPQTGRMVTREIKAQTTQILKNIQAILQKRLNQNSHASFDVMFFLTDMNDFRAMNEVYAAELSADPKPARQCFQVVRLPLDAMVEISCIACAK